MMALLALFAQRANLPQGSDHFRDRFCRSFHISIPVKAAEGKPHRTMSALVVTADAQNDMAPATG
jgi:hypothetical protein